MSRRLKRGHSRPTTDQPQPFFVPGGCEEWASYSFCDDHLEYTPGNTGWMFAHDRWVQLQTCTIYDLPAWR